jgi:PAS domain S-box-containing protein
MKYFFNIVIFLFPLFLFSSENITAIVPKSFPPYYVLDEKNQPSGFAIEILEKVAKIADIKVNYIVEDSFFKVENRFLSEKIDLIPNSGISLEREENSLFTSPTDTFKIVAFKRVTSSNIDSINNIHDKKIVLVKNNIGFNLMKDHPSDLLFIKENHQDAIFSLLSGESDVLVFPELPIYKTLNELNLKDKIVAFDIPLKEIKRAIRVQKDNPELASKLNKVLEEFKKTQEYQQVYIKWFGKNDIVELKRSDYNKIFSTIIVTIIAFFIILILLIRSYSLKRKINILKNKFENMFKTHSSIMFLVDPKSCKIVEANISAVKFYGYSRDELINMNVSEINMLSQKEIEEKRDEVQSFKTNKFEFLHKLKNGQIRAVEVHSSPIEHGGNVLLFSIVQDLTQKKEYEQQLKKKNEQLEFEKNKLFTIIHTLPDPLWIKDKNGIYLACNKRFEDFFGEKEENIIGKTDYDFVKKDLADFFRENDNKAMQSEIPLLNYEMLPFSDGHEEYVQTLKTKVALNDGSLYGILGIATNITEKKKLEDQLLNAQRIGKFGSYVFNIKTDNWTSSFELNDIFGIDEDYEKTANGWLNIIHDDYKQQMLEYLQKNIFQNKEAFDKIYKIVDQKTLKVKWVHGRGELLLDSNGDALELYGMIQDITLEKEQKEIIQLQKEEYETIFNYSHDSIAITDLNANFLNFNNAFIELTGYTKEELLRKNCRELTAPEDRQRNEKYFKEAIKNGHIENFEKDCILKNDKRVSVNISISLLPDKKRLLITLKDISSLKIMEAQTKLASMGEMIGNIAHQWRQPLSIITTSISGLKVMSEFGEITKDDINECEKNILKQAIYLSNTIDNFRNFIKDDKSNSLIFLSDVIKNAVSLVDASLSNNYIKLQVNIKDDLKIIGNKNELIEAFINILSNSKDVLKAKIKNEDDRLIFVRTQKIENEKINLLIYDSGGGIPEDIINKIFIPYFTTKHQSQGTGLGLAMVDKIIRERHHGSISVYNKEFTYNSKSYKGACFSIILNSKVG